MPASSPSVGEIAAFADFAVVTARTAGAILRERIGKPHDVQYKGTIDMVTEADKASEALIAERIRSRFPAHDLLGEEGARGASGSPYRWIVDPIDGTTNFAHSLPTFAVSIALELDGAPLVGVVHDPMRDECFLAVRGGGATLNGAPLRVSPTTALIGSLLATGFAYETSLRLRQADVWRVLIPQVQAIRQTGSSALNLAYVAAGRLDGYWERGIHPWDVAAGALIAQEAGGVVTAFNGGAYHSAARELVASNGPLHPFLIDAVSHHGPIG